LVISLLFVVETSPAFGAGSEGAAASARSTYDAKCASCHGASGKGDGWQSKLFWMKTPNLTESAYMQTRSDDALFQMIKAGGNKGMPAFGLELTEPQIKDLVIYIRTFTKTPGPPKPAGAAR
jgi:mono/diheme cytochrome c family protein